MKTLLALLFLFLACLSTQAQKLPEALDTAQLNQQVDALIEESNNYQQYEVIPKTWMERFRQNLRDSLQQRNDAQLVQRQEVAEARQAETAARDSLATAQKEISRLEAARDEMHFLGLRLNRGQYKVITWSIIGVLLLLVIVLYLRFKSAHAITRDARHRLSELEEEFDQHRKRSLEREQKLRRELQDEINKQNKQR